MGKINVQAFLSISRPELADIEETLCTCYAELEELVKTKEWYSTELLELIETSLEIIRTIKERKDAQEDFLLGP